MVWDSFAADRRERDFQNTCVKFKTRKVGMFKKIGEFFKSIWFWVQLIGMAIVVLAVHLFTKNRKTMGGLKNIQKAAEKAAEEKYEKMSDDDVVDSLVNANDIRNTASKGADDSRALFHNRSKSILSWLGSKGVRREDIPRG